MSGKGQCAGTPAHATADPLASRGLSPYCPNPPRSTLTATPGLREELQKQSGAGGSWLSLAGAAPSCCAAPGLKEGVTGSELSFRTIPGRVGRSEWWQGKRTGVAAAWSEGNKDRERK